MHRQEPAHRRSAVRKRRPAALGPGFAATVLLLAGAHAQSAPPPARQDPLGELSLEELMDVEITSAAKKTQKLSDAMGAVYVLTHEDIRRSGMTTIPDVLRLVPGIQVARISGPTYAISARGFANQFSNKLLVLIDGRSVYTPLFSGVYWDAKDVMLEDVDRIEVIRGPGGALWGANAVNGVINIITKSANETQGTMLYGGTGTEERAMAGARYGFQLGDKTKARIYAKYFNRGGQVDSTNASQLDDFSQARVGFRVDHDTGHHTSGTLQGDYYDGDNHTQNSLPTTTAPMFNERRRLRADMSGGNILARWQYGSANGTESSVQVYYDHLRRESELLDYSLDTFDIDAQVRVPVDDDLEWMLGLGYRRIDYDFDRANYVFVTPENSPDRLFSGFFRIEQDLFGDAITVAVGTKLEHNDYTGFEPQPDVRLRWRPQGDHTIWASYSRAVRVPGLAENDITAVVESIPAPGMPGLPLHVMLTGNRAAGPEQVDATELGYRVQVATGFSIDATGFYNHYDDLLVAQLVGSPTFDPSGPRLVQPLRFANAADGETYGFELASQWRAADDICFWANYSYLRVHLHGAGPNLFPTWDDAEHTHPQNQASVRMNWSVTDCLDLDTSLFYVDHIAGQNRLLRWDLRLGWRPTDSTEASLVFQNLLDDRHSEFGATLYEQPTETERSMFLKVTTRF